MEAPANTTARSTATPPLSELTTAGEPKQQQAPPSAPPPAAEFVAPPKKRKLEEAGFHHSPYYKIRATVANLRGRFLQVCQATGSEKEDVALEILQVVNVMRAYSKKKRLDLDSVVEPVKPSVMPTITTSEEDEPAGKIPSAQKNHGPPLSLAGNVVQNTDRNIPPKPDNLESGGQKLVSPVEIKKEARTSKITDHTKQSSRVLQGSYVIGGSPIGYNFLMWPGSRAAYYGLTKAEWFAHQSSE